LKNETSMLPMPDESAADAQWPASNPANGCIRREFSL
jgi:hypothetical protein